MAVSDFSSFHRARRRRRPDPTPKPQQEMAFFIDSSIKIHIDVELANTLAVFILEKSPDNSALIALAHQLEAITSDY